MEISQSPLPIRIIIADDHPLLREGLKVVLERQPGLQVVGSVVDGNEAVRLAGELQPDVILMDLQMPVKDGLTALQEIRGLYPAVRVIILTNYTEEKRVTQALNAGACGYVLKTAPPEDVRLAIQAVMQGEIYLDPEIVEQQSHQQASAVTQPAQYGHPTQYGPLTHREMEVLYYLAQGLPNKDIARELSLSVRTVTTHVRNILEKLHLPNRTRAALFAREQDLFARPKP